MRLKAFAITRYGFDPQRKTLPAGLLYFRGNLGAPCGHVRDTGQAGAKHISIGPPVEPRQPIWSLTSRQAIQNGD